MLSFFQERESPESSNSGGGWELLGGAPNRRLGHTATTMYKDGQVVTVSLETVCVKSLERNSLVQ